MVYELDNIVVHKYDTNSYTFYFAKFYEVYKFEVKKEKVIKKLLINIFD